MTKKIALIGISLPLENVDCIEITENASLLDYDLIVIRPALNEIFNLAGGLINSHKGRPSLNEAQSFKLKETAQHWHRELTQSLSVGKTIILYLAPKIEVYIDTGLREYSGTGRNQKTTRLVEEFNNYELLPIKAVVTSTNGYEIQLATRGADTIASYWSEFSDVSKYEVIITGDKLQRLLVTRTGDQIVGAISRLPEMTGTLIMLPDINFIPDDFTVASKGGGASWTKKAKEFSHRFLSSILSIDAACKNHEGGSPEPGWLARDEFKLPEEGKILDEIDDLAKKINALEEMQKTTKIRLTNAKIVKALLFEKGAHLENSIVDALSRIGFRVSRYKTSESEFDVVFESDEGRLIGEAEGKDSKPINIDKLRQLSMNVHEDLQRETVTASAKPVLFGNSFRLEDPSTRQDPFTEKCKMASATSNTALVFTPDLFSAIKQLETSSDPNYAKRCREAIIMTVGRVTFPIT